MIVLFRGQAWRAAALWFAAMSGVMAASHADAAPKPKRLYDFCAKSGCSDIGVSPALIRDAGGNFYGTTLGGANDGLAYKLERQDNGKYVLRQMHRFCNGCSEGSNPIGNVILDADGALYGALSVNGPHGAGLIYKLTPVAGRNKWKFSTLYAFCSAADCADGRYPNSGLSYQGREAGLPYDGVSPLYGVTQAGGANNGGVLYKLLPQGKSATQVVLRTFCAKTDCKDGADPVWEPTLDGAGNIFGATLLGGAANAGAIYQIAQDGSGYTLLYSFCKALNCIDGLNPSSPLTIDASGNWIGSTSRGGAHNLGTVYKLMPNGDKSKVSVLNSFCALSNCDDGENPFGRLALDGNGDIYGATFAGGVKSHGILYRIRGDGFTKLFDFCTEDPELQCPNGGYPNPVILGDEGQLFGTTEAGGRGGFGIAYEFKP